MRRLVAESVFIVIRLWPVVLWTALIAFVGGLSTQSAERAMRWTVAVFVFAVLLGPFRHMSRSGESRALVLLSLLWAALPKPPSMVSLPRPPTSTSDRRPRTA